MPTARHSITKCQLPGTYCCCISGSYSRQCCGHLGWLGRGSRSEGTDETGVGGGERGHPGWQGMPGEEPSPTLGNSTTDAGLSPSSRWFLLSSFCSCLNCETQAAIPSSAPRGAFSEQGRASAGIIHCQKHFRQEMKSFLGGLKIQWELIYV